MMKKFCLSLLVCVMCMGIVLCFIGCAPEDTTEKYAVKFIPRCSGTHGWIDVKSGDAPLSYNESSMRTVSVDVAKDTELTVEVTLNKNNFEKLPDYIPGYIYVRLEISGADDVYYYNRFDHGNKNGIDDLTFTFTLAADTTVDVGWADTAAA